MSGRTIVIGIGNPFRSDDAAGLQVLRRLRADGRLPAEVLLAEHDGEALTLIDLWGDFARAIVIDAVQSGEAAGSILVFQLPGDTVRNSRAPASTHGLSLAEALELAGALGRLPRKMTVYGICGENFAPGEGLTRAVENAVCDVASRITEELKQGDGYA